MGETNEEKFNLIKILFEASGEIFYGEISSDGVVTQNVADASEDFKRLIERVQELEKEVNGLHWRNEWLKSEEEIERLREEIERLREEIEQLEGELKEWVDLIEPTLDV